MAQTQSTSIPENQFRPNNTLDASTPLPDAEVEPIVEGAEAPAGETDEGEHGEPSAAETAGAADARAAVEQEARDAGWVDETAWMAAHNGSKKGWRPADQYVDFRRNVLPVVQKEARALRAEVAALKAWREQSEKAERERATSIETSTLTTELRKAAEDQDWDTFNKLNADYVKALAKQALPPPPATGVDPDVQVAFNEFAARNSWLRNDTELQEAFRDEVAFVGATSKAMGLQTTVADALEKAAKRVRRLYPDHPAIRRTPTSAIGESGGESTRMNGGKNHTWANLKPEWRRQAERDVAAGRYSQKDYLANCTDEFFRT